MEPPLERAAEGKLRGITKMDNQLKRSLSLLALATLLAMPASAATAGELRLRELGDWPGHSRDFTSSAHIYGDRIIVAANNAGTLLFDAADPANVQFVNDLRTDSDANVAILIGNHVYTGTQSGDLLVHTLSDSGEFAFVTQLDLPGGIADMQNLGNITYVCTGSGVVAVDTAIPESPTILGSHPMENPAYRINVVENHAFVGTLDSTFSILNVENPEAITLVKQVDIFGPCFDVVRFNNHLYVASGDMGIRIFDVTDITQPELVGAAFPDDYWFNSIELMGDLLLATTAGTHHGLVVASLIDPVELTMVGSIFEQSMYAIKVDVSGSKAVLASDGRGIHLLDLSVPAVPVLDDHYEIGVGSYHQIFPYGNLAFLGESRGLMVVDVTRPQQIEMVTRLQIPATLDIDLDGNIAYLATRSGAFAVDVTNPRDPAPIRIFQRSVNLKTVDYALIQAGGGYVFAWGSRAGIDIIDFRNPSSPQYLGVIPVAGANSMYLEGSTLHVGAANQGVFIYDVSDPANPVEINSIPVPSFRTERLVLAGDKYFATEYYEGVHFVDALSKKVYEVLHRQPPPEEEWRILAADVAVKDDIAILSDSFGLVAFDVGDPDNPSMIMTTMAKGYDQLAIEGNRLYATGGTAGFTILQLFEGGEIRPPVMEDSGVTIIWEGDDDMVLQAADFMGGDWSAVPNGGEAKEFQVQPTTGQPQQFYRLVKP